MIQPGAGFNSVPRDRTFSHHHSRTNKLVGLRVAAFQHGRPEQAVAKHIFTDEVMAARQWDLSSSIYRVTLSPRLSHRSLERAHSQSKSSRHRISRVREFQNRNTASREIIPSAGLIQTILHFICQLLPQRAAAGPCLQHFAERGDREGVQNHALPGSNEPPISA